MSEKYTIQERVRWGDVDAARIIFYGAYIRFFEFAESELLRAIGLPYSHMYEQLDIWLPRKHIECDFHNAARLDDLLEVAVHVERIGDSSIHLRFTVTRQDPEGPTVTATARFVIVSVDRESFAKVSVPPELRAALDKYVGE